MYEPSREFLSFHVAGFSHWYGYEVMHKLHPGTKLRMVPEPDNPYDPNAVALYKGKTKIGFVPRCLNAELAQLLHPSPSSASVEFSGMAGLCQSFCCLR